MKKLFQLKYKYIKMKKSRKLQKIHKTRAFSQKLRYKLPAFSSVEQSLSVGRIFFNNFDSFELGYQTPKYLMPLELVFIKSN